MVAFVNTDYGAGWDAQGTGDADAETGGDDDDYAVADSFGWNCSRSFCIAVGNSFESADASAWW